MFTGIIEDKGKVVQLDSENQVKRLALEVPSGLTEISPGDSINVNGACLTVIELKGRVISLDISAETLEKTNLKEIKGGEEVNLERALRVGDRLGGHIVTGHVDEMGSIVERRREGDFVQIRIRVSQGITKYIVEKGSVAVDGISLTVNACRGEEILMTLIPYTLQKTTLLQKRVGDHVNIEVDILGKYVERLLHQNETFSRGLDRDFLKVHGFLKE